MQENTIAAVNPEEEKRPSTVSFNFTRTGVTPENLSDAQLKNVKIVIHGKITSFSGPSSYDKSSSLSIELSACELETENDEKPKTLDAAIAESGRKV